MSALHLCIDMQIWEMKKFTPENADSLRSAVTETAQKLEANGVQTLYVAFTDALEFKRDPVGNMLGSFRMVQTALLKRGKEALIDLFPSSNALAATKTDYSAASARPIADFVSSVKPKRIILSGAWEATDAYYDTCCLTKTAVDFRKAGYEVSIVAEATNATLKPSVDLAERQRLHRPHGLKVDPLAAIMKSL